MYPFFIVEIKTANGWKKIHQGDSYGKARDMADTTAKLYPLHEVRFSQKLSATPIL